MQLIKKLFGLGRPNDKEVALRVLPIFHRGFGVYADSVLISIHTVKAAADAHCQRLRNQQAHG